MGCAGHKPVFGLSGRRPMRSASVRAISPGGVLILVLLTLFGVGCALSFARSKGPWTRGSGICVRAKAAKPTAQRCSARDIFRRPALLDRLAVSSPGQDDPAELPPTAAEPSPPLPEASGPLQGVPAEPG